MRVTEAQGQMSSQPLGEVLRSAAADSAYVRFTGGAIVDGDERPVTVGSLALVFDSGSKADRTFGQVAQAAHLRTEMEGASMAVETVTGAAGLVSYWGYVHRGPAIVILTLDTLDPQEISMTEFRSLVLRTAERLDVVVR